MSVKTFGLLFNSHVKGLHKSFYKCVLDFNFSNSFLGLGLANPDKPPADPKYCCQSGGDSGDVPCPRPGLGHSSWMEGRGTAKTRTGVEVNHAALTCCLLLRWEQVSAIIALNTKQDPFITPGSYRCWICILQSTILRGQQYISGGSAPFFQRTDHRRQSRPSVAILSSMKGFSGDDAETFEGSTKHLLLSCYAII